MIIQETRLRGCFVFEGPVLSDARGMFTKPFSSSFLDEEIWPNGNMFGEIFWSTSHKNVARGLHHQTPPFAVNKLVSCIHGSVLDLVIDLRSDEPTCGELISVKLETSGGFSRAITIPVGCAHGFVTLSESATVLYVQSKPFESAHESGVLLSSLNEFVNHEYFMSERDLALPSINQVETFDSSVWENLV
jgi:dTDP-4-dehydrorhamnose 3,5-epimerase